MDSFFSNILGYFTDKTRSVGSKSLFFVFGLFCFFTIDYFTGLSFYIVTNNKLSQIEKIERIKRDNPEATGLHQELNKLENQILEKPTISDYFSFFELAESDSAQTHTTRSTDSLALNIEKDKTAKSNYQFSENDIKGKRSNILHVITSAYSFVLLLIAIPFVFFTDKGFDRNMIVGALFMSIMLVGLTWFFSYLFSLIPLLTYPFFNYVINAALHTVFLFFMWLILKNK